MTNKLITRASGIEGTTFENFGYDGLGRMTYAEDDDSIVERWYNSYGQVIEEHQTIKGRQIYTVKNDYNNEGFRMKLTYPNGRQVEYQPDVLNRIDTISEGTTEICDYNYTGPFRVRERNYQPTSISPISLAVSYNANRWATEYRYTGTKTWQATEIDKPFGKAQGAKGKPKKYDWVPQTIGFVYDFDKEGNKLYEQFRHKNNEADLFHYDNVYRLDKVKYGVSSTVIANIDKANYDTYFDSVAAYLDREIFNMDNVGNRTTVTNGTTTAYQTNNLNQYTQVNGTSLSYDLNGNMTNDGYNTNIVYDYTNHPVRFDNADYLVEMKYDALGRRIEKESIKKSDSIVEVEGYILDEARVINDIDSSGAVDKNYVWGNGIDELLATAKGRSRKFDFYLNNSLGSITHIVNDKAEVQESYKYKVYGTVSIYDKKGEIVNKSKEKNRHMFTGREYESEISLYYYRARYYSAEKGRFLQKDPIVSTTSSFNLYIYVSNNPMKYIDPSGRILCIKGTDQNKQAFVDKLIKWNATSTRLVPEKENRCNHAKGFSEIDIGDQLPATGDTLESLIYFMVLATKQIEISLERDTKTALDDFNLQKIDMSDLERFPSTPSDANPRWSATEIEYYMHILAEYYEKVENGKQFGDAHKKGQSVQNNFRTSQGQPKQISETGMNLRSEGGKAVHYTVFEGGYVEVETLDNNNNIAEIEYWNL